MFFAIPFPHIDPILVSYGPFAIRWYSLAYIAGLVIGWRVLRKRATVSPEHVQVDQIDDFIVWATIGIILGGRLGYVLFYNFRYFVIHPGEILAMWQGGMSFHGGFLGVVIAGWLFCRKRGIKFLSLADMVVCVVPIGLFFGRIANFINGELFGRVTSVEWGVVFPRGGPAPRHPSQLYEAALEGAVLLIIMNLMWRSETIRQRRGVLLGFFVAGYAIARMIVEFYREPDGHIGFLALGSTMGQWLSIPMLIAGCGFAVWGWRRRA